MPDETELWMNSPMMTDHPEGFTVEEPTRYFMQIKQPYGGWEPFSTPRTDRDEVTRIQSFHLHGNPDDADLRVWRQTIVWTLDEVPGRGEGQTPPEEILARNEQVTQALLAKENNQQPPQ